MAASEHNNRRADRAEIARHITTEETVAFMTALVAFLKEAEASGNHAGNAAQPVPTDLPPAHADPVPPDATPADRQPVSGDHHADAGAAPTGETPVHTDATTGGASHAGATADIAATTDSPASASVPADSHAMTPLAPAAADHLPASSATSAHTDVTASATIDPVSSLHELGSTITDLVDTSLAAVSHTLDSLTTTVTQLTSTITGTIGQLTDSVTGLVGGLLHSVGGDAQHDAHGPDLFNALVTDIVSTPLASPHEGAAPHDVDIGGLDTAGAVPMAALSPLTLHLGFLGQPGDGHDIHDGAFSALGVHHF
ncbi:hypothetical protein JJB99_22140 [Bradyrhizobium diazoefficiens]|uniref:hypothetical protein n=1 Tax=Bradyrhizobium diazoefficiens TaxID=1355477 RepID=UPI001909E9B7|nr:hypothetical protein [Bradyrhizobium diazoefficiens]QQO12188.1 hypothetical protein JJB99_22140 [Bradyrhizobium diazoefficiens]